MDREELGKIVHKAWVKYQLETCPTMPINLDSWAELSEADKETDRRIGEAVQEAIENALTEENKQVNITREFIQDYRFLAAAQSCRHIWVETTDGYWCVKCGASFARK